MKINLSKASDQFFNGKTLRIVSHCCQLLMLVAIVNLSAPSVYANTHEVSRPHEIIKIHNGAFYEGERRFRFAGTNNYFLTYEQRDLVLHILDNMQKTGIKVLRTWAFLDIGSLDGNVESVDRDVVKNGSYFQYWDSSRQEPSFNIGSNGMEKLDWLVNEAAKRSIRLVLTFTNNWPDIGGIPQYLAWRGATYHDDFFFDETIKDWYKAYIHHLLNRTNRYSGVRYKNDPAIFAWELGNEVRCTGKTRPSSGRCNSETLTQWADEMSAYVKSIDSRHLLTVGDEGFFNRQSSDWAYNGSTGVDAKALANLEHIDFIAFHTYPETWRKSEAWAMRWIQDHLDLGKAVGKPVVMSEYGLKDKQNRDRIYRDWLNLFRWENGDGTLVWMLNGAYADGVSHWDHDGYSIYCPGATCNVIREHAVHMDEN